MSLQVWLPLNGNLNNQGLGEITAITGNPGYKNGKVTSKSLNLNQRINFTCPNLSNLQTFSVCFWGMTEDSSTLTTNWQDLIGFTDISSSGTNGIFRWETTYGYAGTLHGIHWHDNSTNALVNGSVNHNASRNEWCHCCVVFDAENRKIYSYSNGELIATHDHLMGHFNASGQFYLGETNNIEGRIQDVRFYDHALSRKEVEEISKGLVLHYPLNDQYSETIVYDCSGYSNNGTKSGAIICDSDTSRYAISYKFTGSQYIACGRGAMVTDAITISWWGYMDNWANYTRAISCTEGGGWNFEPNNSKMSFPIYRNGQYISATDTVALSSYFTGWHHFAATYDGYKSCLYVDGILKNTSTPTTTKYPIIYNTSNGLFIGAEAAGSIDTPTNMRFNGKLSDIRIYATALSAEDIKELYSIGATIDKGGNVFGYDFIESGKNSVFKEGIVDFDKIIEYNKDRLSENEKVSIFTDSIEAYNFYEF